MKEIIRIFKKTGVIPVIKLNNEKHAVPLAHALLDGGILCAEITFRSSATEEAIRKMSTEVPEMLVGAGTVLTIEQAEKAINAGAKFLVSPGFNPKIVDFALSKEIPMFPGVNDPSAIEAALEKGLTTLKFFPAELSGGCGMLKAFSGPFAQVQFIPTGGVNISNLENYLSLSNVLACGGSWLVKQDLIEGNHFEKITNLASEANKTAMKYYSE